MPEQVQVFAMRDVGLECRDSIGHPIRRRDFCDAHARPLIEKAKTRGLEVYWLS